VGSEDSFVKNALAALECLGLLAAAAQASHRIEPPRLEDEFGLGGLDEPDKVLSNTSGRPLRAHSNTTMHLSIPRTVSSPNISIVARKNV
jgi:hypothetical protein